MKKLINRLTEKPDPNIQVLTDLFTNFRLQPNRYVKPGIIINVSVNSNWLHPPGQSQVISSKALPGGSGFDF